ncbi:ribonuclease H1 [Trypanosoma rangeli SC58]|uniref:ribonuclease H n=1 Tax=Trypanosoma rangeli SC58 TaxID=429131 RepID=A0A061JAD6_TRYRA|nr:ribonuclease H1 [Trypanosoma rangeli SC58]
MPSLSNKKYYAVAAGYKTGIYESWDECSRHVTGFPRARFKSFKTLEEAQAFLAWENDAGHKDTVKGAAADVACGVAPTLGRQECLSVKPPAAAAGSKRRRQSLSSPASLSLLTLSEVEKGIARDTGMLQDVSLKWMKAREQEAVEVYVDGACRANGKGILSRGGYGGYYGENDPRNFSLPLPAAEPQTNNRAELHAVIHVIRTALEADACYNLRVFSDSVYTIRGADCYIHKWIQNGFWSSKGSSVANCDLWRTLNTMRCRHAIRYCDLLVAQFGLLPVVARKVAGRLSLQLVHVKGHTGVHGNEMADHLAVMGALHGRSTDE